jgi:dihydroorotate dehydrogenase (NAD+) catalytic subunit
VDFCGLKLASPLVLLSGCVGFGEEYTRVAGFSNRDVGAIVLKGTTREPRLGNPAHRVYETPMGMLNAIGLQNPGVDHVVDRILPTLDFGETRFFANVCGSTLDDYVEVTRRSTIHRSTRSRSTSRARTSRKAECSSATTRTCRRESSRPAARSRASRS